MAWRERLRDLILAGGAFAVTGGCSSGALVGNGPRDAAIGQPGCGNANADPCICGRPEASVAAAMACAEEMACQARGGTWVLGLAGPSPACELPDGAVINVAVDGGHGDASADR
jgi:hypothetical protein